MRELQNVIERAVILASADRLHIDLAQGGAAGPGRAAPGQVGPAGALPGEGAGPGGGAARPADAVTTPSRGYFNEDERLALLRADIEAALAAAGGRVSGSGGAAELLGLKPSTLASRMRALGVDRRPETGLNGACRGPGEKTDLAPGGTVRSGWRPTPERSTPPPCFARERQRTP